ncbi:MAG TPA: restriction endonuclease subunit S [Phycisphaerales bacterium]|nr:restriction endonuclease subunit S [Phycisphaerales bacterium]
MQSLLDNVEVEWKPLGEVVDYEQPTKYLVESQTYDDNFDLPVLTAGKTFILGYTNETTGIYKASTSPVIIFDDFTTSNKWVDFDFKVKSSAMKMLKSSDDSSYLLKYVYYWLNTLPSDLIDADHKRQWISNYSKKKIPIPPLPVQKEIVRILDDFTMLTTELTTKLTSELTNRKRQYDHYRNQLLRFEDGDVEWKTLENIVHFQNAKPHEKFVSKDGNIALLTAKFISTEGRSARWIDRSNVLTPAHKDDVALVMSDLPKGRALAKTFLVLDDNRYAANQRVCLLRVKDREQYSPRFLHHVMNRNKQLLAYDNGSDQTHLKKDWILKVQIPVPPLTEQARVAAVLDKLDTLTHSISEGLLREIELRHKQYVHYRDLLLSFPKPESVA